MLMRVLTGFLLAIWCTAAFGQGSTATILGTVWDPQDAAVPNAVVTVTSAATNASRTFTTTDAGGYVVPQLTPGAYTVTAEAPGFKKAARPDVMIRVADRVTVDFRLEVGSLTEQVTVQAAVPLVEANSQTLGQVVENRRIVDLPINGRDPFSLAELVPGVLPQQRRIGALLHIGGAIPSIGGAAINTSEVSVDGIPDTHPRMRAYLLIYTPSVDAVAEFKVQTNSFSAEYGRTNGGVISVVTRSGTNSFHGGLYEFHRNSALDANSFFNNRAGIPLGALRRNQLGFTLAGPVLLGPLYNGRNKTFFFADYEAFREKLLTPSSFTVPTVRERAGDFSRTVIADGRLVQIFDPLSVRANPSGAGFIRDPFAGNTIPAGRINPAARRMLEFYPQPTNTRLVGNVDTSSARDNRNNTFDIRIDHYITGYNRIFGRASYQQPVVGEPNFYGNPANPTNPPLIQRKRAVTIQDTHTASPTLLLNMTVSFLRTHGSRTAWSEGYDITELGLPANFRDGQQVRAIPVTTVTGYSGLGNGVQNYSTQTSLSTHFNITKVLASHTLKAGLEYRAYYNNQLQNNRASGNLSFGANFTQGPNPNQASPVAGNGIATFLLGYPAGSISTQPATAFRSSYSAGYLQDDWKIARRLTLNLGLRYEVNQPRTERWDRMSIFDLDALSPIAGRAGPLNLRGAMKFRDGTDRRMWATDWNDIGPRIGFAFQAFRSTVLRGGYGMFYGLSPTVATLTGAYADGLNAVTTIVSSLDGITPATTLSDPFPGGVNQPLSRDQLGPGVNLGQANTSLVLSLATPYYQQWSFSIQQGVGKSLLLEVAYAANKGTRTTLESVSINALTPAQMALGVINQELVANPFFGVITDPTSALSRAQVNRGQLIRPFPQYTDVRSEFASIGSSIYHSFQAKVERRFANGFTLLGGYTAGKNINDTEGGGIQDQTNRRLERSLDPTDVSQRFVVSGIFELPFGRGKHFGSALPRPLDALLGGWQCNGIASFQTGYPLLMRSSGAPRPNRVSRGQHPEGRVQDRLQRYFDTSAFAVPAAFTYGNASPTAPDIRDHGVSNFDLSLFKSFRIYESLRAQLRFEAFNALNRVQFAPPGTTAGTTAFGVITAQVNPPRQLQIALKLNF